MVHGYRQKNKQIFQYFLIPSTISTFIPLFYGPTYHTVPNAYFFFLLQSFFGRTYNNMSSISECKNNGDCIINKKNRTSCKSCRLRKCLLVGMSKSGSRYGRRSNWFKIHCLLQEQNPSLNAQNGLNPNFIGPNGASLYPGLFSTRHAINPDEFFKNGLTRFPPFSDGKHITDLEKYQTSPEDSGGSSAGDMDDESRSTSVTSRGAPNSHQTPSPFSDKDFNQKKLSITVPSSPNNTTAPSPFPSPQSVYTSPYVSPPLRHIPSHIPFPVAPGGITPIHKNLVILDHIDHTWNPMRSGSDLLLYSPAPGGVPEEQNQPIDLSVKSCLNDSPKERATSPASSRSTKSPIDDSPDEKDVKCVHIPLDLTSKRHQELTTHSSWLLLYSILNKFENLCDIKL